MDDRPGIFERIPLFFLAIAALLLAAGAGIWLQGNQTTVDDECAKATLTRDDYEDDLVATDDDDDCDDEIDLVRHKKNWRIPVAILQQHNNSDDTNDNGNGNNNNNDTDDTDDTDDDSPPNGTYTDDSPDTDSGGNTDT